MKNDQIKKIVIKKLKKRTSLKDNKYTRTTGISNKISSEQKVVKILTDLKRCVELLAM